MDTFDFSIPLQGKDNESSHDSDYEEESDADWEESDEDWEVEAPFREAHRRLVREAHRRLCR